MSTQKYIKIVGGAAHVVTERIERTVRLEDLLAETQKDLGVMSPILPTGCRLFRQKGDRMVFVIEQAPTVRSLEWDGRRKLAFPYVIFVIAFSGDAVDTGACRIFYSKKTIGSEKQELFRTNLCNVYQSGSICTGSMRVQGNSLAEKAESFVAEFWQSRFNWDLSEDNYNPTANKVPQVASLERWQKESAQDPFFPLSVEWLSAGKLSDYLEV